MAPKAKAKGKAKASATGRGAEPPPHPKMTNGLNQYYIESLQDAINMILDHRVFHGILDAMPLSVSGNARDSGSQAPFNLKQYQQALRSGSHSYTAGINLFWIDPLFSATPAVPARIRAIEHLRMTVFRQPATVDVHIAVPGPKYNPLQYKGALRRVSPEELTAAVLMAIARAIEDNEPDAVLREWRRQCLSTTATFKQLPDDDAVFWYAVRQRDWVGATHRVVTRSTIQHIHEIRWFMNTMRETWPANEVTGVAVASLYAEHLTGGCDAATVTAALVENCEKIANTPILDEPEIAYCFQDLDEWADVYGIRNPFASHDLLAAIADKCCTCNLEQLVWVMQGIWYHYRAGHASRRVVKPLEGNPIICNYGLVDLLLFKLELKHCLLNRAAQDYPEVEDWLKGPVAASAASHKTWLQAKDLGDQTWRTGLPLWQGMWCTIFEWAVFGWQCDAGLKLALRSGMSAAEALDAEGGIGAQLRAVDRYRREAQIGGVTAAPSESGIAIGSAACSNSAAAGDADIVFTLRLGDGSMKPKVVKLSEVYGGRRKMLNDMIRVLRQQMAARIHLVSQQDSDPPNERGLQGVLMDTTVLRVARGAPDPSKPSRSKYIGIFFDPKLAGEASQMPMIRVPPLRASQLHELVTAARTRFGAEVPDNELPPGDLYFLFDGGKVSNQKALMRPFAGLTKSRRTLTLWHYEMSVAAREQRERQGYFGKGIVGSCRQHEHLYVVSAACPAVAPVQFKAYIGTSEGTMMGPIASDRTGAWQLPWGDKKKLFTPLHLIPPGSGADSDDEDQLVPAGAGQQRDNAKPERVFYHALPEAFYDELLRAFPLSVVLDLTPGDGSLALACYRHGGTYIGTTLSQFHRLALQHHLEQKLLEAMTTMDDPLFDPRLTAVLDVDLKSEGEAVSVEQPQGITKAKSSKANLKRKYTSDCDSDSDL